MSDPTTCLPDPPADQGTAPASLAWQRLSRSLLARHRFASRQGDELRIVLAFGADRGVRVGVRVQPVRAYGDEAVAIFAELGDMTRIDPWDGLRVNMRLAFGGLAIDRDILVVRAILPAAGLTGEALELRLQRVAAEAAQIKHALYARTPATDAFDHYAA